MKVQYDPKFKFPIFIHSEGQRTQTISIKEARGLYRELGDVLKKILPEKHEDIRFGAWE